MVAHVGIHWVFIAECYPLEQPANFTSALQNSDAIEWNAINNQTEQIQLTKQVIIQNSFCLSNLTSQGF